MRHASLCKEKNAKFGLKTGFVCKYFLYREPSSELNAISKETRYNKGITLLHII